MNEPSQDPNWLAIWITALVPLVGAIGVFVKRFLNTVTRAELREAIQDSNEIIDERHKEHLSRLDKQDKELKEIRDGLRHLEGVFSGRYPTMKGP